MFIASAVHLNTNIPAPAPATPEGWVLLAVGNILNAPANHLIPGLMALVLVRQHINTPVPALDIQAGQVLSAAENILLVNVPAVMNGKMGLALTLVPTITAVEELGNTAPELFVLMIVLNVVYIA